MKKSYFKDGSVSYWINYFKRPDCIKVENITKKEYKKDIKKKKWLKMPTNLFAESLSQSIKLTWDYDYWNQDGFDIAYKKDWDEEFTLIPIWPNNLEYLHEWLDAWVEYTYKIRTVNEFTQSQFTEIVIWTPLE